MLGSAAKEATCTPLNFEPKILQGRQDGCLPFTTKKGLHRVGNGLVAIKAVSFTMRRKTMKRKL
jgi:hypothetical protein